ncbi:prepilin-type N-terminal cleavage/methylation domain-containing protein [Aquabacterium fontiphilum]|jgi:type IV fimbrial biogenesis protein FimT|uniref:pilus assembly FimT family protein n=1 Tax=Aquabacterium fontiphilum TaxID=450365 RepID=UPI001377E93D|nr:GspH/FimT family pseudopilin [Aquabacterium fontiphilum]NBD21112.1 prepilin-type N-terminal cleavage/methylation domain-containing protein [Aquabacterium fontiphilum]
MRTRGVSLVEIAVTLAVLALLLMAAAPSMSEWLRSARLRNQGESVLNGIQAARNEAVRRNVEVTFWLVSNNTATAMNNNCALSSTGNGWVVSRNDPAGFCGTPPSSTVAPMIVTTRILGDGGTGAGVRGLQADGSTAATSITFDGLGRAVQRATAAENLRRIAIAYTAAQAGDRPLQVDVDASGGIRLCDTTVTDAGDPRACPAVINAVQNNNEGDD